MGSEFKIVYVDTLEPLLSIMSIKKQVFFIATFFLLLGISCYAFLYPNKFHFITLGNWGSWGNWQIETYKFTLQDGLFISFIYVLTSYCHIVFMTFYSILITNNLTTRAVIQWGFFWGVIDSIFEILQLKESSENTPPANFWLLNNINRYLENGHFDSGDLVFIWLGVASAIYFWWLITRRAV